MFTETINPEAQQANNEALNQFFRMYGDETASTYSNLILETLNLVMQDEMNNPRRSDQELADLVFELKELNKLVVSLQRPTKWASTVPA